MPPREWRLRIEDILEAAGRIARYVEGKDLSAFEALWKTAREDLPTLIEPLRKLLATR